MKEIQINFPKDHYYQEEWPKKQIVLHHTVSGPGARGDYEYWIKQYKTVATFCIIDRTGDRNILFDPKYWAYHLKLKSNNTKISRASIGIELDSYGPCTKSGENFLNIYQRRMEPSSIITLDVPYKNCLYYERYSQEQIDSAIDLIKDLCKMFSIPKGYNEDMWNVSQRALEGEPGIWTHTSYREDKSDCYPDPYLINKLKSL